MATTSWYRNGRTTARYVIPMGGAFQNSTRVPQCASGGPPPPAATPPSAQSSRPYMLTDSGRCMSLCLYEESRTGKTLWARSLGKHLYCVGLVSGDECMKGPLVDYAVFDDIRGGIKFFPSFKEWLGCQAYVTVKCLYREPKLIKWGKPSIWLANTDPRDEMAQADIDWMNMNCTFISIDSPIFHANTM